MKLFEIPMVVTSLAGLSFLAGLDAPPARADFIFGEATNLGPTINSPQDDYGAVISPDGLELYFCSNRAGGSGMWDIWVTKRASAQDPWGPAENLGPETNTPGWDAPWSMSTDGLTLYIEANGMLCTISRSTGDAPWGPRANLDPTINSPGFKSAPIVSADGLELFFSSDRPGGYDAPDIWMSAREAPSDPWEAPTNLGSTVNTPDIDAPTWISPDGLTLLFFSTRPGGYGTVDTWRTTRPSKDSAWGPPTNLGPSFNTADPEMITAISSDGRLCYFNDFGLTMWGPHPGGLGRADIWQAPILPIVDFSADGKVDLDDLVLLIENWGTDDTLYDIGPYAWGDGVVDAQDLLVLAEHMVQNPTDVNDVNDL